MTAQRFPSIARAVPFVRRLLTHRRLVLLLCTATLLLKLVVPAGYMIASHDGRVTVTICSGVMPRTVAMEATMAGPGMHAAMPDHGPDQGPHHGKADDRGQADMPCAFAGLATPLLGAVDPLQLAALVAFVMAIGLVGTIMPAPFAAARLRPPSHGPPADR